MYGSAPSNVPNWESIAVMPTKKVPKKKPEVIVLRARLVPVEEILPLLKTQEKLKATIPEASGRK
jgi:hypothetical protein